MTKKRIFTGMAVIALAAAILTLTACGGQFDRYNDDEFIASGTNVEYKVDSVTNTVGGVTTWSVNRFGGITDLFEADLADNATLSIELEYTSGQMKVVAVTGSSVIILIEDESCKTLSTTLSAGRYTIKLVGNEAKFKIIYSK